MNRRSFLKLSSALSATSLSDFNIEIANLDSSKKYLVIVTADEGWWERPLEDRDKIEREILFGFRGAGIDPMNVGVIVLFGFSMEITEVTDEEDN